MKKHFKTGFITIMLCLLLTQPLSALTYTVKNQGLVQDKIPDKQIIIQRYQNYPIKRTTTLSIQPNYQTGQQAGQIDGDSLNRALELINLYRLSAGLNDLSINPDFSQKAQAATFILGYLGKLSHNPEGEYKSYLDQTNASSILRQQGQSGASDSNLARFSRYSSDPGLLKHIDVFMFDGDDSNREGMYHRFKILNPLDTQVGFGFNFVQGSQVQPIINEDNYYGALYMNNYNSSQHVIAWPSTYTPYDLFKPVDAFSNGLRDQLFSLKFSNNTFNVCNAQISLKRLNDNTVINLDFVRRLQTYKPSLIFGNTKSLPIKVGDVFEVTITGVTKGGLSYPINYTVEIIDKTLPKKAISISFEKLPSKLHYLVGEPFDSQGGILRINYDDKTSSYVDLKNSMVSGFNSNNAYGAYSLTVTYNGLSTNTNYYINRFKDVCYGDVFYPTIMDLVNRKIANGYQDQRFGVNDKITRAQVAVMLVNALKLPITPQKATFIDVPITHYASSHIAAAVNAKILNGYGNNKFGPEDYITRAQLAVMVSNAFKISINNNNLKSFGDVPSSHWAYKHIQALASHNIVNGYANNLFKPDNYTTRAEFSKFISYALNKNY